jgi:carboxypeptidase Q
MTGIRTRRALGAAAAGVLATLTFGAAAERIDYGAINKIKAQGLQPQRSKVMEISSWLTDVYGPRLSGSPNLQKAGEWAAAKLKEWGLQHVSLERWSDPAGFARGWSNDKFYMAAVSPQAFPIPGTPTAWTPGTNGLVRGEVVLVTDTAREDLQKYAGTLKGKWILTQAAPDVPAYWTAPSTRNTIEDLERMALATPAAPEFGLSSPLSGRGGPQAGNRAATLSATEARNEFFRTEGALGLLSTTQRGHGIYVIGGSRAADPAKTLPAVIIPAEQYGRMARILAKNLPVTIEAEIRNTYHPNPEMFNVVGEIPGTDLADQVVMLGAHFDSWHASTGATDNAAGSAAMLEAMRILKQSGVPLRRTVRIALWTGEEQGLLGSKDYVAVHFAGRGTPPATAGGTANAGQRGAGGQTAQGPLELKPAHAKLAGYFNIDNGTGAIRGIYLQGNDAAAPIFREWIEPFRSLGMAYLTIRNTGGTDHTSFDNVGLPGFQFIQDDVEYGTMTHHTNLDSYERLQPADMMKNATIAAAFAYLTANREDMLPRKPVP